MLLQAFAIGTCSPVVKSCGMLAIVVASHIEAELLPAVAKLPNVRNFFKIWNYGVFSVETKIIAIVTIQGWSYRASQDALPDESDVARFPW
jgi:hypothetical protein